MAIKHLELQKTTGAARNQDGKPKKHKEKAASSAKSDVNSKNTQAKTDDTYSSLVKDTTRITGFFCSTSSSHSCKQQICSTLSTHGDRLAMSIWKWEMFKRQWPSYARYRVNTIFNHIYALSFSSHSLFIINSFITDLLHSPMYNFLEITVEPVVKTAHNIVPNTHWLGCSKSHACEWYYRTTCAKYIPPQNT